MAKLILEFDTYEDRDEIELNMHANDYVQTINDLRQSIRNRLKYDNNVTEVERMFLESLRDRIHKTPGYE